MQKIITSLLLFSFCTLHLTFALNPSRTYKTRPDKYNMEYQEAKVKTDDGAVLNVWEFFAKVSTKGMILLAHNGEGNMADYLRRVDQFTSNGYHVIFFDYRGYGESSEFEIDNSMYIYPHFQDDFRAMIDYCRSKPISTFSVYGWGIGAGLALGISFNDPAVERIIADTPFLSMEDLEEKFSDWDEPMEVPFAGYSKKYEPLYTLDTTPGRSLKGILIIMGSNDILYSPDDMKRLASKQEKLFASLYVVENPDRKDNFLVDKAAYFSQIKSFMGIN